MKKIILITILVVLGLSSEVLSEERISVRQYFGKLRWCPNGDSIAFVANFSKHDPSVQNPDYSYAIGIGRVKPDGSELQVIASNPWISRQSTNPNNENSEGVRMRQRIRSPEPSYPGGYKAPAVPVRATTPTPFFSHNTFFEWSADGKSIIFADFPIMLPQNADMYLWTVNADGTSLRSLLKTDTEHLPTVLQRLENGKIALRTRMQEGSFQCLDPESGKITNEISIGNLWPACYYFLSPNGKMVLFEEKSDIYVVNLATRTKTNLTRIASKGTCRSPAWSPNGKKVVFEFQPKQESSGQQTQIVSIWVVDIDGTNSKPVAPYVSAGNREWVKDTNPAWSPDGKTITFLREHYKEKSEYSIEVAGIEDGGQKVVALSDTKNQLVRKD